MKGGYKSLVNFSNMLNAGIIDVGETIYFKIKNTEGKKIKIPLKIHSDGILEYNNEFYSDNEGLFILPINNDEIKLPEYLKYDDDNHPVIKKSNNLFSAMKIKENIVYKSSDRKAAHKFMYTKKTNKNLYLLVKKNISKIKAVQEIDDSVSSTKKWLNNGIEMKGLGTNSKGRTSSLRYYLSEKNIYFKAFEKWSYKNILLFIDDRL